MAKKNTVRQVDPRVKCSIFVMFGVDSVRLAIMELLLAAEVAINSCRCPSF